jgi:uncharacterized membrane protein
MNTNSIQVLSLLIKKLQIPVTRQSIVNEIQKHPDSTSLLAISEVLERWNIPNAAYHVTNKELLETEIPLPFIACFKHEEFVLVNQINKKNVTISNERWDNHQLDITEFRDNYLGVILAAEKDAISGDPDYPATRRKEIAEKFRIPFLFSGVVVMLLLFLLLNQLYLTAFTWDIAFLTVFKTAGLVTSILLLMQSIDRNNPLIHKLCGTDDNKNCNAILTSSAAKITEELSWSEVGFFYFAGSSLVLLFSTANSHLLPLLAILNLISLPYSFYSIYYQGRVAKQWCIFCCTIQAILWLEFFCFLPYIQFHTVLSAGLQTWASFIIGMLLPVLLWVFIKPHLVSSEQLKFLKPELYRFKYNKELFGNLIEKGAKYGLLPEENTIVIGNKEADNVITVVASPFCKSCANAHKLLDDLIDTRSDIKLQFIFLTRIRARELDGKILSHFMLLKSHYDEHNLKKALNDWFSQKVKNYDLWQINHPVNEVITDVDFLKRHKTWCQMADVTGTPTLFINGRKLPGPYRPEDIKYII